MSRSLKKGPYIEPKLEARVIAQNEGGKRASSRRGHVRA